MNSNSILNLCLKVMGVFYALRAVNTLPSSISQILLTWNAWKPVAKDDPLQMMLNFKAAALASLLIPLIVFIISLVVVFKSEKICSLILKSENLYSSSKLEHSKILCICIILLGFFSLLESIPSISSVLSKYLIMKDSMKLYDNKAKIEVIYSVLRSILYICAGAFLILQSATIAKKISALVHIDEN